MHWDQTSAAEAGHTLLGPAALAVDTCLGHPCVVVECRNRASSAVVVDAFLFAVGPLLVASRLQQLVEHLLEHHSSSLM